MNFEEMLRIAKATVLERYTDEEDDKLSMVYTSGVMELQRILLQSFISGKLFLVTLNKMDLSTSLKTYIPEE